MSSWSLVLAWVSRMATGSLRFAGGLNSASLALGKAVRRRLPVSMRSAMEAWGAVNRSSSFLLLARCLADVDFVDLVIYGSLASADYLMIKTLYINTFLEFYYYIVNTP